MLDDLDYAQLDKELDRTKTHVFIGTNAAFYAPLMCSLDFEWNLKIPTAATNGVSIMWNPLYFKALGKTQRISILVHELKHVALMHMLRRGNRDPKIWNYACDTVLDNQMDDDGYELNGLFPQECGFGPDAKPFTNHAYDNKSAEEIYEIYYKNPEKIPSPQGLGMDLIEGDGNQDGEGNGPGQITDAQKWGIINKVIAASHAAKLSGAGDVPGEIQALLDKFLKPKLPWEQILYRFFNDLGEREYSWARPRRRYISQDLYLPSLVERDGLDHLNYYFDVSGSVTDPQVTRFNSEVKYVKEVFNPHKLSLIQFDTKIQDEIDFGQDDPFDGLLVKGRGGTSLVCVREHILKTRPTAAIIFSDMQCTPMKALPKSNQIPIIWIALDNPNAEVPHGTFINLSE